ncbi:MAG: recombinase RecT [Gammaproteobacteria bacterium]|nr:recombinase RecT [Gammaproteobacteria bacterium]MCP5197692.1 recombinase RecT [Gammaproteobacteria bacterium]
MRGSINQLIFDDRKWNQMMRVAEVMASGKSTVPAHLRGSVGDCMAIVLQSARWNMDPYAVAQKTHMSQGGIMGYEAQLVNAVIITRAPIKHRPKYEWFGDWAKILGKVSQNQGKNGGQYSSAAWDKVDEAGLGVRVIVTLTGEEEPTPLELLLVQAQTRFSTMWAGDPRQQLAYLAIKRWARLYCPDVLMGVYTTDELEGPNDPPPQPTPTTTGKGVKGLKSALTAKRQDAQQSPPPPPGVDPETGEVIEQKPLSIDDLVKCINAAQSDADLEKYRDQVAALKNGERTRATDAWKARKATFTTTDKP